MSRQAKVRQGSHCLLAEPPQPLETLGRVWQHRWPEDGRASLPRDCNGKHSRTLWMNLLLALRFPMRQRDQSQTKQNKDTLPAHRRQGLESNG